MIGGRYNLGRLPRIMALYAVGRLDVVVVVVVVVAAAVVVVAFVVVATVAV